MDDGGHSAARGSEDPGAPDDGGTAVVDLPAAVPAPPEPTAAALPGWLAAVVDRAGDAGLVRIDGRHGGAGDRAVAESLRAARGRLLWRTGRPAAEPHENTLPETILDSASAPTPAEAAALAALIALDPALKPQRAAARALAAAGLPLAVASAPGVGAADAEAFAAWARALPRPATATDRSRDRPAAGPPLPPALAAWAGPSAARAAAAQRAWRLRRWGRLAFVTADAADARALALALWGPALVVAPPPPAALAGALAAARGATLLVPGADQAAPDTLDALAAGLAAGGLRVVLVVPEGPPGPWQHLGAQRLVLPPPEAPAPPVCVAAPGAPPTDRPLLTVPPVADHDRATVRCALAVAAGGRPAEDRAVAALARRAGAGGRPRHVARLRRLHAALPPGPLTVATIAAHDPAQLAPAARAPGVLRVPVGAGGVPAMRQEWVGDRLHFDAAGPSAPGRVALEGLPPALARALELRRSPAGLVAALRAPLPPHALVTARPFDRVSALPVVADSPVQLGRAGVVELCWPPGISLELELYADPEAAAARRPTPAPTGPVGAEEEALLLEAVLAAARGGLPWDEALPRELRRRVHSAAGRTAAGRVLSADAVGALAALMASPAGQGLRRALGAAVHQSEAAPSLMGRLPRRVRRLLPPLPGPRPVAVVPEG